MVTWVTIEFISFTRVPEAGSAGKEARCRVRASRLAPRTLACQAVALQVAVVVLIVVVGSALAVLDARADSADAAREEVTAIATSLADAPSTADALASADPSSRLQPVAEQIRAATGIAFITIMAPDRTRYTHTDPAQIGRPYVGTVGPALRGETFTETYTGTLGPSIRTAVPVRAADGRIVGIVAAGITLRTLTENWVAQLPLIAGIGAVALMIALAGLWLIRRRLLRHTGGLAPDDLRVMYDHHDAVLHAVREGLVVSDAGRPVLVNDAARRLLGISADGSGAEVRDGDVSAFLVGGDEPLHDQFYAVDGRVLLVNRVPVQSGRATAVITVRDRTEIAEALGELDSMTRFAEALRSQAHESANRLHTIVALIEMGRADEAAGLATGDLALAQRLVDRVDLRVTEPTLGALLLGKSAEAAERGIAFTLTEESAMGDDAAGVLSAADLITVVGNLIDNALDACDPDDPWVEITVVGDADGVRIVVADSGAGMSPDALARALRRGYSTKSGGDRAGRGLGLALVAQVVAGHRGSITATDTYGSVVTVQIDRPGAR